MKRQLTSAILLTGAILGALSAVATAEHPRKTPRFVSPLSAACYSPPFGAPKPGRLAIPAVGITGGEPGRRFLLRAQTPGKSEGSSFGTFDANGNATLATLRLGNFVPIGPGRTYRLTLSTSGGEIVLPGDEDSPYDTDLGTVRGAALGVEITQLNGSANGTYRPGQKYRVAASGAQFGGKTLYGFIVKGDTKVLERFKIGTADACGAVETKVVTRPLRYKQLPHLKIYVNAGPTFKKARAVRTPRY
jgi:hypothetical protein